MNRMTLKSEYAESNPSRNFTEHVSPLPKTEQFSAIPKSNFQPVSNNYAFVNMPTGYPTLQNGPQTLQNNLPPLMQSNQSFPTMPKELTQPAQNQGYPLYPNSNEPEKLPNTQQGSKMDNNKVLHFLDPELFFS